MHTKDSSLGHFQINFCKKGGSLNQWQETIHIHTSPPMLNTVVQISFTPTIAHQSRYNFDCYSLLEITFCFLEYKHRTFYISNA